MIDLNELCAQPESEHLDFKQEWHRNKTSLLHDILCLANANHDGDRMLVIGVANDRSVIGIQEDKQRLTQAKLTNWLCGTKLYQVPEVRVVEIPVGEGVLVDVLVIKNMPNKPYLLTHDYRDNKADAAEGNGGKGAYVRAGIVYTRVRDTNTPISGTASPGDVEKMYQERFGLNLPKYDRILRELAHVNAWSYDYDNDAMFFFHRVFTEMTIRENLQGREDRGFDEPWVRLFPDPKASRGEYSVRYGQTQVGSVLIVWCDGARWAQVLPETYCRQHSPGAGLTAYYLAKDSLNWAVQNMVNHVYTQNGRIRAQKIIHTFESEAAAEAAFDDDLDKNSGVFTYFGFDEVKGEDYQLRGQDRLTLTRR